MNAGRPRSFDEQVVLDRAMELFWQHGYRATSLADLLERMEISRQSLYGAFGSKRELFLRVLEHYRATQLTQALALLDRPGPHLENVRAVVRFFEALGRDEACRGCLVANSLVELGAHDEEIGARLRETLGLLQQAVAGALREAQQAGELAAGKAPDQIARALTNAMVGMAVTGRLRLEQDALGDVSAGTLSMLD